MLLDDPVDPLPRLLDQLRRPLHACVLAQAERPRDHEPRDRVGGAEHVVAQLAVGAELALDVPRDVIRHPHLGGADGVAELPRGTAGELARIEVGGPLEVVLGLGRVGDLAADPREPEHAHGAALVRVADQVELAALEQQVVGVDGPRRRLAGLHRVVLELDPLAAVDRGVDLGQPGRQLGPARRRRDAEPDRLPQLGAERAGPAPGDLLQRQPQRLGVGELAVEQRERGLQGGALVVGELDRRQMERLGGERVVLLLGEAVGRLVDGEVDAERVELGAVGVEAAGEGVLGHVRVPLDVAPDLGRGDRTALGHQVRDQRQLPDQLFGVLRQGLPTLEATVRRRCAYTPGHALFAGFRPRSAGTRPAARRRLRRCSSARRTRAPRGRARRRARRRASRTSRSPARTSPCSSRGRPADRRGAARRSAGASSRAPTRGRRTARARGPRRPTGSAAVRPRAGRSARTARRSRRPCPRA